MNYFKQRKNKNKNKTKTNKKLLKNDNKSRAKQLQFRPRLNPIKHKAQRKILTSPKLHQRPKIIPPNSTRTKKKVIFAAHLVNSRYSINRAFSFNKKSSRKATTNSRF